MAVYDAVKTGQDIETIGSAPFGADIFSLVSYVREKKKTVVYVSADERRSNAARRLTEFAAPSLKRITIPAWDCLPYDRVSPSAQSAAQRCAALAELADHSSAADARIIHLTATSLVQKCAPRSVMSDASLILKAGAVVEQKKIDRFLERNGYTRVPTVRDRGEFAQRGGIIDIYSANHAEPVRLDFFGDSLETIRSFDPDSQRSTKQLSEVKFTPVSEIFFTDEVLSGFRTRFIETFGAPGGDQMYEAARSRIRKQGLENWLPLFHDQLESLFDYIGTDALWAFDQNAFAAIKEREAQAEDYFSARVEAAGSTTQAKVLAPGTLYLTSKLIDEKLGNQTAVRFSTREVDKLSGHLSLDAKAGRDFGPERATGKNIFDAAVEHVEALGKDGFKVCFAAWSAGSVERLRNVLADHGLSEVPDAFSLDAAQSEQVSISELPVDAGFVFDGLAIISEQDILGEKLNRPKRRKKASNFIAEASALAAGDLVVHVEHGVALYKGLTTVEVSGAPHDCLELHYQGGDKLLLPVENIELVSRYGSDASENVLDKLGGVGWQARKAKAKKRIMEMADGLIKIAAERAMRKGQVVDGKDGFYDEFAARFPYEETEDQLRAIEECLGDLSSGRPMDRLICGDVGFGKTEVALRTAFVAAMSGVQVAVIAPTTLLARQHYQTFKDRLAGWPITVKPLSRLVGTKEASETRKALKAGTCEVVIGTHAVLAKTVDFKNLGLLVIDEEQRFGVKHKERMKELKADVHVLTLSATPIPRTLQMALTGIRDLSIIATPPVDRLSVRTYVTEFDTLTIREALLRERYRGGQAFIVAPRVNDLPEIESFLRENVPEVSFVTAHGQMPPGELDEIMTDFYDGKYDVLLSTTIVESGLDIPRANTLILHCQICPQDTCTYNNMSKW